MNNNLQADDSKQDEVVEASGPQTWLFYLGATALLFAVATDAIAVIGRHLGIPLLGSIELVQAAIVLVSSASIVSATVGEKHAVVHLFIDRLKPRARAMVLRGHAGICAIFFLALSLGSMWIAFDLRDGHEESELLHIPYFPLRAVTILTTLGIALLYFVRLCKRPQTHE